MHTVKFGRVVFELCEPASRQTDRHTHHNTSHSSRGELMSRTIVWGFVYQMYNGCDNFPERAGLLREADLLDRLVDSLVIGLVVDTRQLAMHSCIFMSFSLFTTRSHPEIVGDMSRVTLNFDLSKISHTKN